MADKPRIRRRRQDAPPSDATADAPKAPGSSEDAVSGAPSTTTLGEGASAAKPTPPAKPEAVAPRERRRRGVDIQRTPKATTKEPKEPAGLSALEALVSEGAFDMDALMAGDVAPSALPEPGMRIQGPVTRVSHDTVYVDLGARAEGWIARRDAEGVAIGETIEAFVVRADDLGVELSLKLTGEAAARHLEEAHEGKIPVEGKVEAHHGGGYTVRVGPVRAFCPISQMSRLPLADPASVVGETFAFLVRELGEKVVLSRRDLQEAEIAETRDKALALLEEGHILDATITSVQPWGVFLDADGIDLRMPKHEASWEAIDDVQAAFDRGQRLPVRVVRIDRDAGRITVSAKDPALDPWQTVSSRYSVGSVHRGTVVTQTDFGVFVQLVPGLQGLVHRSTLPAAHPSPGTSLEVRVLSVDAEQRRLALAPSDFDPALQAQNTVGIEVTGEVIEVAQSGVAVRLEDGRRGWLPAREVELDPGTVMSQRFRVGHTVTARIASEDPKRDRITLTQRSQDNEDWRGALAQAGTSEGASMGTLGDLLGGWKKR